MSLLFSIRDGSAQSWRGYRGDNSVSRIVTIPQVTYHHKCAMIDENIADQGGPMKRLLLIVPIVFLLFLNACGTGSVEITSAQMTILWQTETAKAWTAIPTTTFNPHIPTMVSWLNTDLFNTNSLGSTMDAQYSVTDITIRNHSPMTFRINVNCICRNDSDCCIPERTFVVILESLRRNSGAALQQVPPDVSQLMVVCSNERNAQIGAISVSWQSVQAYLHGNLTGYELGVQVTRTRVP
jgi:hypothetical protein